MSVSEFLQRIERLEEHCKIEATKVARLWRMHEGMMALQTPIVVPPSPATRLGEAGVRSEAEPWKTYNPLPASLDPTPAPAASGGGEPTGSVDERAYADRMGCDEERDFANRILDERDAAIRERRAAKIYQSLTADRFASAVMEADTLQARVAELEVAAKLAPRANDDGEANHAAQAASGGGEGEPVAWARRFHECYERLAPQYGYETRQETRVFDPESQNGQLMCAVMASMASIVCGHYRDPPQPRGWLTKEEREFLKELASGWRERAKLFGTGSAAMAAMRNSSADMVESILARSSPPEVIRPKVNRAAARVCVEIVEVRDAQWIAAIAAAGLPVKEVQ